MVLASLIAKEEVDTMANNARNKNNAPLALLARPLSHPDDWGRRTASGRLKCITTTYQKGHF